MSTWSKDQSTKVGCVIVGTADQVLALGYNGFPRGVKDKVLVRHERPLKYKWTEHAERNAIYNAARTGTDLTGSVLYVNYFPCVDCARAVIQAGIAAIVTALSSHNKAYMARLGEDFKIGYEMLSEAGIHIWYQPPERN